MALHDTETPTPSPSPAPTPSVLEYGIVWTLKKGNAIYQCSGGITGNETVNMDRDANDIPQIPTCDSGANDDRDPSGDEEAEALSFFHTEYKWNNVEISFSIGDNVDLLRGFEIEARVYSLEMTPAKPDDPNGPSRTFKEWVPYRVRSATIISEDPNSGNTWVYDNPRNYGGVILFTDSTPVDKDANSKFVCGIAESAYNYVDVFDDVEFGYIPRNTYENKEMTTADKFQFEPLYPDVKDANGLAAPIYPMNAVTAFVPDGRESVTVTYKVSLDVVAIDKNGIAINTPVQNPDVTIKQTVEQDTSDYIGQLEELGKFCQFQNPGGFKPDELSPNYNYDYPYTLVAGFDGVPDDGNTSVRGDDKNNERVQKGDVLYIPSTDERLTWSVADIPERLTIIDGGSNYRDNDAAITIKAYETDKSFDKDIYPNGRPPRCYESSTQSVPTGLLVDIETEDGKIVSAEISEESSATGWEDGDVIRVVGGNNNAELRIHIDNPPGWTDKFINKY
jgi:hypothetical protein